jgi:hypothetical protein
VTSISVDVSESVQISVIEMIEQGPSGPRGETGATGATGATGPGVPIGGTTGQRLVKKSNVDLDVEWKNQLSLPDRQIAFQDGDDIGGDTDLLWDKNTKSLIIGQPELFTNDKLSIGGALDDYLQSTMNNSEEGTSASADWIATNDKGTDDSHYVDMGINSSVYDDPDFNATKANDAYLLNEGGDLVIGAITEGKKTVLVAGGATVDDVQGHVDDEGIDLVSGKTYRVDGTDILDNRPQIFYGISEPPSPIGLADGSMFFKHEE